MSDTELDPAITKELDRAETLVTNFRHDLATGANVDLGELESLIQGVCATILQNPPEDDGQSALLVTAITRIRNDLDTLGDTIRAQNIRIASAPETHRTADALKAYSTNSKKPESDD